MTDQQLSAADLAEEFGVSPATMTAFIDRFAPARVAAGTFGADADIMLFVHIPKTAGVSVGHSLREAFDRFHGVKWDDIARSFRSATRHATYAQTGGGLRQVIMGHYGWPELQLWRNHEMPMKCGAILREPVARAISNYNYNCSTAHPGNADFRQTFPTLESYVAQIMADVQLTQALGMSDSFETILQKFIRHYTFLGVTEQLSASLEHLGRSHGLTRLKEYRENVGLIKAAEEVPAELRKQIESKSRNDIKIHRLVSRLYGA